MDQEGHPPLGAGAGALYSDLDHQLERRPQAVRLAQERRRDPRIPGLLLPADQRLGSLAGESVVGEAWWVGVVRSRSAVDRRGGSGAERGWLRQAAQASGQR